MTESSQFDFACVIVAGGSGQRFGGERPKQFQELNGHPLYIWSIYNSYHSRYFRRIILVVPSSYIDAVKLDLAEHLLAEMLAKVSVIAGGDSRQASVMNALLYLEESGAPDFVVMHDAARPLAGPSHFAQCARTLETRGACSIGLPVSDTIKSVENGIIKETIDRSKLWSVQTPQGAPFELLLKCHKKVSAGGISVTDDAAVLEACGHEVHVFTGFSHNIKVTVADDFKTCELLASLYLSKMPIEP